MNRGGACLSRALWREEKDALSDWYIAEAGDRKIEFRFLWFEATNQTGADPSIVDFHMPGLNGKFAFGTEACNLIMEILGEAFPKWKGHVDPSDAEKYLLDNLKCTPEC